MASDQKPDNVAPLLHASKPDDVGRDDEHLLAPQGVNGQHQEGALQGDGNGEAGGMQRWKEVPVPPQNLAAQGESITTEANRALRLAAPIVASELLSFFAYLVTTAQAGALGASALSAFTLARTVFHITGLSLIVGLGSGSDTFTGQAFGAGEYKRVGIFLQRATVINLCVTCVVVTCWLLGAEPLLLCLHQDPDLASEAAHLLHLMAPSLVLWSVLMPVHAYFSGQGVMGPLALLSGLGVITTPIINHVLATSLGLGIQGIALGYNAFATLDVLGLVTCMVWLHYRQPRLAKTWSGFNVRAALSEWPAYLKIALPSMAMICLDWWCFEVVVLVAGLQPNAHVQLGAMGVMFATHSLAYMVCSGLGTAAATRVSNELGAGHGAAARRATIVCLVVGFGMGLPIGLGLYLGRQQWAHVFTTDDAVVEAIAGAMLWLVLSVVTDSINGVLSGVLRGCGHQAIGFAVNLVTFWGIGIPAAYQLDIVYGLGARGVWMALAGVSALQAAALLVIIGSFNWDKEARRAQLLLASGQPVPEAVLVAAAGGPGGHHGVYEPLLGAEHA